MFERQIRLSRYDCEKLSNTSVSNNSRVTNQHRDIRSPNRSRSISPNDMALRQRRTVTLPTQVLPSTTLSVPKSTSYPDLVISHTPIETNKINHEQSLVDIHTNEMIIIDKNHNRPNLLTSSDTEDYQPLDFKSRLALFNERSNGQCHIKKISNNLHSNVQPNFITKPIVHHHHQSEKKDIPSVVNTNKSITFFGGTKYNGTNKSIPSPSITIDEQSSVDIIQIPDIIGGNVKLNKSSIFSGMKKVLQNHF